MNINTVHIEYHIRNADNQPDFSLVKFRRGQIERIYYANKQDHKRLLRTLAKQPAWVYAGFYVISIEYAIMPDYDPKVE